MGHGAWGMGCGLGLDTPAHPSATMLCPASLVVDDAAQDCNSYLISLGKLKSYFFKMAPRTNI